jgi:hypothetical protein
MSAQRYLGREVRDTITGFQGVVTGYVKYLTGCNQCLVVGKAKDGKPGETAWFDEQRMVVDLATPAVVLDNAESPGFDRPAPRR